ncbi:endogenous retrovirus group FC1 Env polyprotein-like [Neoarius graeffei]|uniref:endogenous retrovirus group FC1 Env polyprotein-like n=1 Tax=Neoarius graeffei TaxID=443677 RepID=UPI00298BDDAB|nr:endogenous retrovirus group FC1 Env polyprotein-like [Neoarius graeffei]
MPPSTIITRPPLPLCSEALYYAWGPKGQPFKFWGPFCNYSLHPSVVAMLNQTSSVSGTDTPNIILQDSILTTLQWSGVCAPIRLKNAITAIHPLSAHRPKRDVYGTFPPLTHQLTSEWHHFWTSLFPHFGVSDLWREVEITHYHLASFVNETTRAVDGIRTELTALHLMTTQNHMALDILLAEKGGVCAMVGESCCTFVPANDNPDGEIGVAVHQMKQITQQLEHDEHGDSAGWMWFSRLFEFCRWHKGIDLERLTVPALETFTVLHRALPDGSRYHFNDGLWYDPTMSRTHNLPIERRTR